jgi:hypothetical protein
MVNDPNQETQAQEPQTKAELLERIRDAYADYEAAIEEAGEGHLKQPNLGFWTVRDVIAHVGADEQWMAGQLEALQAGQAPTALSCYGDDVALPKDIDLSSQDGRNAWQHRRLAGLTPGEVQAMAASAHGRIIAAIDSFGDDQLLMTLTIADLPPMGHIRPPKPGETAWPLWEWIRGVTYFHYADHATSMRAPGAPG